MKYLRAWSVLSITDSVHCHSTSGSTIVYWVDMKKINEIYRFKTEEYSHDAISKFNIYPDQIPSWLVDWIPEKGGYLIGKLQPAHMDFRFFSLGNMVHCLCLTTPRQAEGILNLIEDEKEDLVGNMALKVCYLDLEYKEWRFGVQRMAYNNWQ